MPNERRKSKVVHHDSYGIMDASTTDFTLHTPDLVKRGDHVPTPHPVSTEFLVFGKVLSAEVKVNMYSNNQHCFIVSVSSTASTTCAMCRSIASGGVLVAADPFVLPPIP